MATELLPDALWEEVEPLLPPRPGPSPKGGRPPVDDRAAVQGTLYVDRHGIPWQALPTALFGVSGSSSCWRKLRDWTKAGVWPALHGRLLNRLGRAGGVDLGRVTVDSQSARAPRGGRAPKPGLIFGDRAYGTAAMIALVVSMGIGCFLARRNDPGHGSGLGQFRHVVERTLANLGQFRRVKFCYERTPEHFQALNEIAACCLVATRLKRYET